MDEILKSLKGAILENFVVLDDEYRIQLTFSSAEKRDWYILDIDLEVQDDFAEMKATARTWTPKPDSNFVRKILGWDLLTRYLWGDAAQR